MLYFHPLNFIRFILSVGVVLFHYGLNYYPFNEPILKTLILNSAFRVSFFFFISGFVMMLVYGNQSPQIKSNTFYKKRFTRLFPVYWFAFICTLLLVIFVNGAGPKGIIIILHALGLQSWNPGYVLDLNYPTWSISVELFFYMLFPFLMKFANSFSVKKLISITFSVWILQSMQHIVFVHLISDGTKVVEEFINAFPLWHISTFFVGMVTAKLILSDSIYNSVIKYATLFLGAAVLIFLFIIYIPNPILKYIHNGLLSPLFALFVIALFYDKSFINKFLSLKSISMLGDLSYGLFIFQYPVWIACTKSCSESFVKSAWFFLIYFIILVLVAVLVNNFFEKPLLRFLRKNDSNNKSETKV